MLLQRAMEVLQLHIAQRFDALRFKARGGKDLEYVARQRQPLPQSLLPQLNHGRLRNPSHANRMADEQLSLGDEMPPQLLHRLREREHRIARRGNEMEFSLGEGEL